MSDDFIVVVPHDPKHVPTTEAQQRVAEQLSRIAPNAESIEVNVSAGIQFFDCGENFERIACPACSSEISIEWWHERMDGDFADGGFRLSPYKTPCCGGVATLNELVYDGAQAFGRCAWTVMNPDISGLDQADLASLETAAGIKLLIVRQHI